MEYYSAIKKNEILPFVTTWMNLEGEISQRMTSSIWGHLYVESKKQNKWTNITKQKQTHRQGNKQVVARREGGGKMNEKSEGD